MEEEIISVAALKGLASNIMAIYRAGTGSIVYFPLLGKIEHAYVSSSVEEIEFMCKQGIATKEFYYECILKKTDQLRKINKIKSRLPKYRMAQQLPNKV